VPQRGLECLTEKLRFGIRPSRSMRRATDRSFEVSRKSYYTVTTPLLLPRGPTVRAQRPGWTWLSPWSPGQNVAGAGFNLPPPWSRTRFRRLLNSIEFCGRQAIGNEGLAANALLLVDSLFSFGALTATKSSTVQNSLVYPHSVLISFWILESC